jgi:hypothetical protein
MAGCTVNAVRYLHNVKYNSVFRSTQELTHVLFCSSGTTANGAREGQVWRTGAGTYRAPLISRAARRALTNGSTHVWRLALG